MHAGTGTGDVDGRVDERLWRLRAAVFTSLPDWRCASGRGRQYAVCSSGVSSGRDLLAAAAAGFADGEEGAWGKGFRLRSGRSVLDEEHGREDQNAGRLVDEASAGDM